MTFYCLSKRQINLNNPAARLILRKRVVSIILIVIKKNKKLGNSPLILLFKNLTYRPNLLFNHYLATKIQGQTMDLRNIIKHVNNYLLIYNLVAIINISMNRDKNYPQINRSFLVSRLLFWI